MGGAAAAAAQQQSEQSEAQTEAAAARPQALGSLLVVLGHGTREGSTQARGSGHVIEAEHVASSERGKDGSAVRRAGLAFRFRFARCRGRTHSSGSRG